MTIVLLLTLQRLILNPLGALFVERPGSGRYPLHHPSTSGHLLQGPQHLQGALLPSGDLQELPHHLLHLLTQVLLSLVPLYVGF